MTIPDSATPAGNTSIDADELIDEVPDYDLVEEDTLTIDSLSEMVTYTLDWSVQSLLERVGTSFDITPNFQRRDAWSPERKSLYIESLILGLPVPQIVLAEDPGKRGRFIVLDGKQRLMTMKQFAAPDDSFKSFALRKLEFANELEGMTFAQMQSSLTAIDHAENLLAQPIRTIVVRNWHDPAVLYQVFVRLNQGSLSLSPQELRQALFPSDFTRWVNVRSAGSSPIQRARRIKHEDFRMRDAEMLLRFIAFAESIEDYRGNLRKFLDDACVAGAQTWKSTGEPYFEELAARCEKTIERTFLAFHEQNSFLRYENGSYNRRFNIAVFDLMMAVLGDESITDDEFAAHQHEIRGTFETLCEQDRVFSDSLQTTTKSMTSTSGRIVRFGDEVGALVGHPLPIVARAAAMFGN